MVTAATFAGRAAMEMPRTRVAAGSVPAMDTAWRSWATATAPQEPVIVPFPPRGCTVSDVPLDTMGTPGETDPINEAGIMHP